jgi:hypothetical protein
MPAKAKGLGSVRVMAKNAPDGLGDLGFFPGLAGGGVPKRSPGPVGASAAIASGSGSYAGAMACPGFGHS